MDAHATRTLESVERSIKGLSVEDALRTIDKSLQESADKELCAHLEARKAGVLWGAGRKEEAVELLQRSGLRHPESDTIQYLVGEYLVELRRFEEALSNLTECLEIIQRTDDSWLKSAATLLRAYCAARLGMNEMAARDLSELDEDEEMSWISSEVPISKSSVRKLLEG